jgi:hypothetical protein
MLRPFLNLCRHARRLQELRQKRWGVWGFLLLLIDFNIIYQSDASLIARANFVPSRTSTRGMIAWSVLSSFQGKMDHDDDFDLKTAIGTDLEFLNTLCTYWNYLRTLCGRPSSCPGPGLRSLDGPLEVTQAGVIYAAMNDHYSSRPLKFIIKMSILTFQAFGWKVVPDQSAATSTSLANLIYADTLKIMRPLRWMHNIYSWTVDVQIPLSENFDHITWKSEWLSQRIHLEMTHLELSNSKG